MPTPSNKPIFEEPMDIDPPHPLPTSESLADFSSVNHGSIGE